MTPPNLLSTLQQTLTGNTDLAQKIALSVAVITVLLAIRWLFLRLLDREQTQDAVRYRWHKSSSYIITILGFFFIGSIWIDGVGDLATFLGLASAGLAIALREPIANMAGWGFLLIRKPFTLNDRIEIEGIRGDVVDLRIFAFTLMEIGNWVDAEQSTGRMIHIPNAKVFTNHVANYTQGFQYIWHEIPVVITFESDWEKAKAILSTIVETHALTLTPETEAEFRSSTKKFKIAVGTLTPTVYTRVVDIGVQLTLRYLTKVRKRRTVEEAVWEDILRAFAAEPDITLAYPTQRVIVDK